MGKYLELLQVLMKPFRISTTCVKYWEISVTSSLWVGVVKIFDYGQIKEWECVYILCCLIHGIQLHLWNVLLETCFAVSANSSPNYVVTLFNQYYYNMVTFSFNFASHYYQGYIIENYVIAIRKLKLEINREIFPRMNKVEWQNCRCH